MVESRARPSSTSIATPCERRRLDNPEDPILGLTSRPSDTFLRAIHRLRQVRIGIRAGDLSENDDYSDNRV